MPRAALSGVEPAPHTVATGRCSISRELSRDSPDRQKLAASGGLSDAELPATELPGYCRCNGIRRLELFRSATRADFGPQSDVDLLFEFRPEARIGLVALSRIQRELSVLFGRSVDRVPRAGLKPVIESSVLKQAKPVPLKSSRMARPLRIEFQGHSGGPRCLSSGGYASPSGASSTTLGKYEA